MHIKKINFIIHFIILQKLLILLFLSQVHGQIREPKAIKLYNAIGDFEKINLSTLGNVINYIPISGGKENVFLRKIVGIDFSHDAICISDYRNCFLFDIK